MKIKTEAKQCKSVGGVLVKVGDVVDADENTARNLIKKGYASAADDEARRLNLEVKSRLGASQAQANISKTLREREKAREEQERERKRILA